MSFAAARASGHKLASKVKVRARCSWCGAGAGPGAAAPQPVGHAGARAVQVRACSRAMRLGFTRRPRLPPAHGCHDTPVAAVSPLPFSFSTLFPSQLLLLTATLLRTCTRVLSRLLASSRLGRSILRALLRSELGEVANRRAWHNSHKLTAEVSLPPFRAQGAWRVRAYGPHVRVASDDASGGVWRASGPGRVPSPKTLSCG